jgi:cell division protein FtsQ
VSGRSGAARRPAGAAAAAWLRRLLASLERVPGGVRGALAALGGLRPRSPGVALGVALRAALARLSPRTRRWLLAGATTCLVLAGGYQFWLRDSSFVAVQRVTITGVTTSDAQRVRVALTSAARTMTTLHVDRAALDRAVQGYPVVRKLDVSTDFPHGLRIRVIEHHPAAIAVGDDGRMPVAGDGTILRGMSVEGHLPTIHVDGSLGTTRLGDGEARAAAAIAGGAPAPLRPRIDEVRRDSEDGLVAELRDGPELIFGDASRVRAKWAAAARVLADLEARGASYVDLRIPDRPAAGGLASQTITPVAPAGTTTTTTPQAAGSASTSTSTTTGSAAATQTGESTTASPTTTSPSTSTNTQPTTPYTQPTQSQTSATGTAQGGAAAPTQASP